MDSKQIPSAGPDFQHLLAQEIVIEGGQEQQLGVGAPLRMGQALPAASLSAAADLQREVEQFLYRQAELLDGKHWQAFIDLFDDEGVYWMPVTPQQTEWESSPSIFAEDRLMMEIRKGRVSHPNAWSQAPDWETSHLVSHVVLESAGAEIVVRSRFHMMELRRDEIRHFGGRYRHTLVRDPQGQLRIRLQRVDLFNSQAPFDYVLQVWV
jgi:3-phenylpropionate/cinnamic acid dioxygenase small subunit